MVVVDGGGEVLGGMAGACGIGGLDSCNFGGRGFISAVGCLGLDSENGLLASLTSVTGK